MRRSHRPWLGSVGLLLAAVLGRPLGIDAAFASTESEIPPHPNELELPRRTVQIPPAEPYLHRLSQGTPAVVVEDHTLPLVELFVVLPADDAAATPTGLEDLTAAMMRRGGTERRSADALDEAIDSLGAEIRLDGGDRRRVAHLDCLAATFDEAVAILFEILRRPAFDPQRFESLRANLASILAGRNDDPIDLMERELAWILYGRSDPRARQLTGPELEAIEVDDLAAHHRRAWRPEGAILAVSGAIDTARALRILESQVALWRQTAGEVGPTRGATKIASAPPTERPTERPPPTGFYWVQHPTPQAKVSLARTLAPIDGWNAAEIAALDAANEILGGTGLLSRLGGRLRGREGLVYRVLSEVERRPDAAGLFRIYLDTSTVNVPTALDATVDEIERLRQRRVSPRELEAIRQELLSRLAQRFDSADEIAGYLAENLLLGRPHSFWPAYREQLERLGAGDVQRAARRTFDPARLVVVGAGSATVATDRDPVALRHPLVRRWLDKVTLLPTRDPYTLERLEPSETAASNDPER
ncbi:MAG: pitrilysin family protein [Thermoanaerobaculia bacterium]|nr:pitrilysin family protein [Thermoanaerobaculia bacterium]